MSNDRLREILDKATASRSERQLHSVQQQDGPTAAYPSPAGLDIGTFFDHHKQALRKGLPQLNPSPRLPSEQQVPPPTNGILPPVMIPTSNPPSRSLAPTTLLRSYRTVEGGKQSRRALPAQPSDEHLPAPTTTLLASTSSSSPRDAQVTTAVSSVIDTLGRELEMGSMGGSLAPMERWRLHEDAAKSALFIQGNSATRKVVLWAFEEVGSVVAELEGEVESLRCLQSRALAEQRASTAVIRSLQAKVANLEDSLQEHDAATFLRRKLDVCEMARSDLEVKLLHTQQELADINRLSQAAMGEVLLTQMERGIDAAAKQPPQPRRSASRSRPSSKASTANHTVLPVVDFKEDSSDRVSRIEARCVALEYRNMALSQEIGRLKAGGARYSVGGEIIAAAPRGLELSPQPATTADNVEGYVKMTPRPARTCVQDAFQWDDDRCPTTCREMLPAICEAHRNLRLRLATTEGSGGEA